MPEQLRVKMDPMNCRRRFPIAGAAAWLGTQANPVPSSAEK
jgi:hypothetical protein